MDPLLIDQIYEAALAPEHWPFVLHRIASLVNARGALLIARQPSGTHWIASPPIAGDLDDYMAQGWGNDPSRIAKLFSELHPGFRAETYYAPAEVLARMPVHAEFLAPRGYGPGTGTVIQGMADSALHMGVEGFINPGGPEAAVDILNRLRPHICRAFSLAAIIQSKRIAAIVDALDLIGVGAAIISPDGRCREINETLERRITAIAGQRGRMMRFRDEQLQTQFAEALAELDGQKSGRSLLVRGDEKFPPFAIHLLPLRRQAKDIIGSDGIMMLASDRSNVSIADADLLRILYDLTPAEARLTRALMEGRTLNEVAGTNRVSVETVRSQLRSVFQKTGVRRQVELVRLLAGLGKTA